MTHREALTLDPDADRPPAHADCAGVLDLLGTYLDDAEARIAAASPAYIPVLIDLYACPACGDLLAIAHDEEVLLEVFTRIGRPSS